MYHTTCGMMHDHIQESVELFNQGYNCSQAVFSVYAKDYGIDPALARKIATGFGAGVGRTGNICGAVSGAILALGLVHGMSYVEETTGREKSYALDQEFMNEFTKRFGSVNCADLLGYNMAIVEEREEAKKQGVVKKVCPVLVQGAAEILADILRKNETVPVQSR